jgi:hypothetical protein
MTADPTTGMKATVAWWELAGTGHTVESMRDYLRGEAVGRFSGIEGLRLKIWIAEPAAERWGAVLLWESAEAAARPLPPRAAELIGRPPVQHTVFDVEAVVEGRYADAALAGRGALWEAAHS